MKVELKLDPALLEPVVTIRAPRLSEEVRRLMEELSGDVRDMTVTGEKNGRYFPLRPEDVELIRVEGEKTMAYLQNGERYEVRRRLYELEKAFSPGLLRISKGALVNLGRVESVEPTIGGLMRLFMKSGQSDYISRKYLPAFKAALGLGGKRK
ncbi:LytTR family DNA-binding domain-containing protein [Zongyangia hominis]|uniref:LytTR family transcriptional regulator n=1 Tax=Zongyangia hominis TaxID=2763677 RepID=A0A926EAF5_9FIRM|nr:LytTR family DNA-binding domain-containing protein [Zongyangia hominis]MBC8570178.1 LytTR family transcriptional regulator [Zongyangia hominis]